MKEQYSVWFDLGDEMTDKKLAEPLIQVEARDAHEAAEMAVRVPRILCDLDRYHGELIVFNVSSKQFHIVKAVLEASVRMVKNVPASDIMEKGSAVLVKD